MKDLKYIQILFSVLIVGIIAIGRTFKDHDISEDTRVCEEWKAGANDKENVELTILVHHNKLLLK